MSANNPTTNLRLVALSAIPVLTLAGCETPVTSGQVMCWTESALNAAHAGVAPLHAPPRGVVYAYDPGIVDLICIPIVARRVAGEVGVGGGTATPQPPAPSPTPQQPAPPPSVEGVQLGSGAYTLSTTEDRVAAVPSAVNPGQMNVAAKTTNPQGNLADAIIDSVFEGFGMERSH